MKVVGNAVQSHLAQLIGHHHSDAVEEAVQVFEGDLLAPVALEEDVLHLG